eukprot:765269-Hanusia_phi.AAC.12
MSHEAPTFGAMPKQEWISKSVTQSPPDVSTSCVRTSGSLALAPPSLSLLTWSRGRSGLGKEGAEVTSRTIQDKKVQVKEVPAVMSCANFTTMQVAAEIVAKEVALELLRSPVERAAGRVIRRLLAVAPRRVPRLLVLLSLLLQLIVPCSSGSSGPANHTGRGGEVDCAPLQGRWMLDEHVRDGV